MDPATPRARVPPHLRGAARPRTERETLYESGADVVISGHDHVYERFALLGPDGVPDPLFGLRQIVVGTGGRDYRNFGVPVPGSEVRIAATFGVLKLTLHPDSYDWEFIPEAGKTLTDSGTSTCHGAPPPAVLPAPDVPEGERSGITPEQGQERSSNL